MPKIDETIKNAIIEASKALGSQAELARKTGVMPSSLSRFLNGQITRINKSTWLLLYPHIKKYLPDTRLAPPRLPEAPDSLKMAGFWVELLRQYAEEYGIELSLAFRDGDIVLQLNGRTEAKGRTWRNLIYDFEIFSRAMPGSDAVDLLDI